MFHLNFTAKILILAAIIDQIRICAYAKIDNELISPNEAEVRPTRQESRIVGGKAAARNMFPYQVSLKFISLDDKHFCGGFIYSESVAITAAHCFYENVFTKVPIDDVVVVAGEYDQSKNEGTEQRVEISDMILFPNYKLYPGYNDIALLKLKKPFKFNDSVKPIRVANKGEEGKPNVQVTVAGWGYTQKVKDGSSRSDPKGIPKVLQFVELDLVDKKTCTELHAKGAKSHAEHKNIICAGALEGGRDTCQGDSGGPLVCSDSNYDEFVCGIVQGGVDCGYSLPGFYTKVANFHDFIVKNVGKQSL